MADREKRWTFLTNHAHVLLAVARQPNARLRDIAAAVGVTERTAFGILRDLEDEGYVTKRKEGRRNAYEVHGELKLRHPMEQDAEVGRLLGLIDPGS